eukprot:6308534-Alexandrium_andersonii.AAC.1
MEDSSRRQKPTILCAARCGAHSFAPEVSLRQGPRAKARRSPSPPCPWPGTRRVVGAPEMLTLDAGG